MNSGVRDFARTGNICYNRRIVNARTQSGFDEELKFWREQLTFTTPFAHFIRGRLDSSKPGPDYPDEVSEYCLTLQKGMNRIPKVLDLGSGPLSMLLWGHRQKHFELYAVDPLADQYMAILKESGQGVPHPLVPCFGERLTEVFGPETFDLVWIYNSLDHAQDPETVFRNAVATLVPNGRLIVQGWAREGTALGFTGLHRHDLWIAEGPILMCQSIDHNGIQAPPIPLDRDLPLAVTDSSQPSTQPRSWMRIAYRKIASDLSQIGSK